MTNEKPAAACSRQTCEGCAIRGRIRCVHTPRDVAGFFMLFLVWAIPFFVGMIIGRAWIGLGVWGGLALLFFGYVEQLLLCRHCPHYAEPGFFLRCHANWGLPKIPRFSPRPMSRLEGAIWLLYGALLFLYYVPFFVISQQWLLLGITTAALIAAVWTVRRTRCTRCYHLSCPANRLPEDVRAVFLKNYPRVLQIVCAGGPLALDDDTGLAQHGQVLGEAGPEERGAYQGKRVMGLVRECRGTRRNGPASRSRHRLPRQ